MSLPPQPLILVNVYFLNDGGAVAEVPHEALGKLGLHGQHPVPILLDFPSELVGQDELDDLCAEGAVTVPIREPGQVVIWTHLLLLNAPVTTYRSIA